MSNNNEIIKQNILSKDLLLEIILTAIFISFGLNLIVTSFSNLSSFNILMFVIGAIIVISSSIVLIYKNFKKFNRTVILKGFIVYDEKENKLIDVHNYHLSNELVDNLNSAFEEEESLKIIWDNLPLSYVLGCPLLKREEYETSAKEIIEELFECFIFDRLSSALNAFFYGNDFKNKELIKYEREDIPKALLNNRFLNLFSKPLDERKAFEKEYSGYVETEDQVLVMCSGEGGALYHKLHLVLPVGTRVERHNPQGILLESNQIAINFDILFDGCNINLPLYFEEYYLGLNYKSMDDILRFNIYNLELKVDVKFKIRSLFSNTVWNYNKWLDDYLNSLHNEISMDHFFESINWDQISTLLYMAEDKNLINKAKENNCPKRDFNKE